MIACTHINKHFELQWGHDSDVVEDRARAWEPPGARELQWGHDSDVVEDCGTPGEDFGHVRLQWGHDSDVVEDIVTVVPKKTLDQASMGPRL